MMDQDKALEKALKCLARAEGTDSEHEAETALRQARALMDKYHLDMGDVLAAGVVEHQVRCGTKSKPTNWMFRLASVCADAFNCQVVGSPTKPEAGISVSTVSACRASWPATLTQCFITNW